MPKFLQRFLPLGIPAKILYTCSALFDACFTSSLSYFPYLIILVMFIKNASDEVPHYVIFAILHSLVPA